MLKLFHRWRKTIPAMFAGLFVLCGSLQFAGADAERPREQRRKVAFLYNSAKFVQWPDTVFKSPGAPFRIAVVGEADLGPALSEIEKKTIHSRRIVVDQLEAISGLDHYHLVFLSRSLGEKIDHILAQLEAKPVLTISDAEGFSGMGGIIQLYETDQTIRFNVNMERADHHQLKISSKLLKLARLVERQTAETTVHGNTQ